MAKRKRAAVGRDDGPDNSALTEPSSLTDDADLSANVESERQELSSASPTSEASDSLLQAVKVPDLASRLSSPLTSGVSTARSGLAHRKPRLSAAAPARKTPASGAVQLDSQSNTSTSPSSAKATDRQTSLSGLSAPTTATQSSNSADRSVSPLPPLGTRSSNRQKTGSDINLSVYEQVQAIEAAARLEVTQLQNQSRAGESESRELAPDHIMPSEAAPVSRMSESQTVSETPNLPPAKKPRLSIRGMGKARARALGTSASADDAGIADVSPYEDVADMSDATLPVTASLASLPDQPMRRDKSKSAIGSPQIAFSSASGPSDLAAPTDATLAPLPRRDTASVAASGDFRLERDGLTASTHRSDADQMQRAGSKPAQQDQVSPLALPSVSTFKTTKSEACADSEISSHGHTPSATPSDVDATLIPKPCPDMQIASDQSVRSTQTDVISPLKGAEFPALPPAEGGAAVLPEHSQSASADPIENTLPDVNASANASEQLNSDPLSAVANQNSAARTKDEHGQAQIEPYHVVEMLADPRTNTHAGRTPVSCADPPAPNAQARPVNPSSTSERRHHRPRSCSPGPSRIPAAATSRDNERSGDRQGSHGRASSRDHRSHHDRQDGPQCRAGLGARDHRELSEDAHRFARRDSIVTEDEHRTHRHNRSDRSDNDSSTRFHGRQHRDDRAREYRGSSSHDQLSVDDRALSSRVRQSGRADSQEPVNRTQYVQRLKRRRLDEEEHYTAEPAFTEYIQRYDGCERCHQCPAAHNWQECTGPIMAISPLWSIDLSKPPLDYQRERYKGLGERYYGGYRTSAVQFDLLIQNSLCLRCHSIPVRRETGHWLSRCQQRIDYGESSDSPLEAYLHNKPLEERTLYELAYLNMWRLCTICAQLGHSARYCTNPSVSLDMADLTLRPDNARGYPSSKDQIAFARSGRACAVCHSRDHTESRTCDDVITDFSMDPLPHKVSPTVSDRDLDTYARQVLASEGRLLTGIRAQPRQMADTARFRDLSAVSIGPRSAVAAVDPVTQHEHPKEDGYRTIRRSIEDDVHYSANDEFTAYVKRYAGCNRCHQCPAAHTWDKCTNPIMAISPLWLSHTDRPPHHYQGERFHWSESGQRHRGGYATSAKQFDLLIQHNICLRCHSHAVDRDTHHPDNCRVRIEDSAVYNSPLQDLRSPVQHLIGLAVNVFDYAYMMMWRLCTNCGGPRHGAKRCNHAPTDRRPLHHADPPDASAGYPSSKAQFDFLSGEGGCLRCHSLEHEQRSCTAIVNDYMLDPLPLRPSRRLQIRELREYAERVYQSRGRSRKGVRVEVQDTPRGSNDDYRASGPLMDRLSPVSSRGPRAMQPTEKRWALEGHSSGYRAHAYSHDQASHSFNLSYGSPVASISPAPSSTFATRPEPSSYSRPTSTQSSLAALSAVQAVSDRRQGSESEGSEAGELVDAISFVHSSAYAQLRDRVLAQLVDTGDLDDDLMERIAAFDDDVYAHFCDELRNSEAWQDLTVAYEADFPQGELWQMDWDCNSVDDIVVSDLGPLPGSTEWLELQSDYIMADAEPAVPSFAEILQRPAGASRFEDYEQRNVLGEGTFGIVYEASRKDPISAEQTRNYSHRTLEHVRQVYATGGELAGPLPEAVKPGTRVALKEIRLHRPDLGGGNKGPIPSFPVNGLREIRTLKRCQHPNVIELLEMAHQQTDWETFERGKLYMVFPLMEHDLAGLLKNPEFQRDILADLGLIKHYFSQLLLGLDYLHENAIIHRDIKPANILVSAAGVVKIADFGLARFVPHQDVEKRYTNQVVTRWYRAPEVIMGERNYRGAVDIWSAGCILGEMLMESRPSVLFPGTASDAHQLVLICNMLGTPAREYVASIREWPNYHNMFKGQPEGRELAKFFDPDLTYANQLSTAFAHLRNKEASYSTIDAKADMLELLSALLTFDAGKRVTAKQALYMDAFWAEPLAAKSHGDIPYVMSRENGPGVVIDPRRRLPIPQLAGRPSQPRGQSQSQPQHTHRSIRTVAVSPSPWHNGDSSAADAASPAQAPAPAHRGPPRPSGLSFLQSQPGLLRPSAGQGGGLAPNRVSSYSHLARRTNPTGRQP
ncbi:hypothetical protein E5Q_03551 [Mixia osmundae IAM 14324]|uniref:Protein kinase domain-containing protein n=1 Tax=Mixia osmundae (strain CBS 9802 / IAM 14324 / JCM 22182 / KY 12970) TaxID=764103 RepID=G7E1W5_MIXOS|nr:hypothetical protein E5Q_03551 [Mixia osmundae IAM 14324]